MKRISDKIEKILNEQIKKEYESSFLYQKIAQCLEFNGWFGAAKLYKKYSAEEQTHAQMFMEYMQDIDCEPEVPMITQQKFEFKDIEQVAKATYDHEVFITDSINNISLMALAEKDITTHTFVQKLVNEQIGELSKSKFWIDRIQMMKSTGTPLYFLDSEMENSKLM